MRTEVNARAARYASILERMIGPEGSYPVVGRSICYRFGVFQMLSQAALEHMLEPHLGHGADELTRKNCGSARDTVQRGAVIGKW